MFDLLVQSAEAGDAQAQTGLGVIYANGRGVPQDYARAAIWYRKAADQGEASAQYNLGVMYEKGQGVPQDYAQAVVWFRRAADQGIAIAQYNLGVMYDFGRGVPQDDAQAMFWYRKAADQGIAGAQNNLGLMYANGQGVPRNNAEAVLWFQKAADQGDAEAQSNLDIIYANGQSVPQTIFEIESDIGQLAGGIFAAWFMANPNGPTVWALGYVERDGRNDLFYRWMHFTGGRTWIIGNLESDIDMLEGDFGEIVFNSVIRFHNHCLAAGISEQPILSSFPSFICTNGNGSIGEAFRQLMLLTLARADWAREFYLNAQYGADFYSRAGAETRATLEAARRDQAADQERIEFMFEIYARRSGFSDSIPDRLKAISPSAQAAMSWWDHAARSELTKRGLSLFAEMWAGATSQVSPDYLKDLKKTGHYTSLSEVVEFFDQFQMPLWPIGLDDRKVCEAMGVPTRHLD